MSEQYVTLAEVRDLLEAEQEKRGEQSLLASHRAALDHARTVCPTEFSLESANALIEEVGQLEEVSDSIAVKIADIRPKYPEDVRAIFSKERIVLDNDKINQILDIVAKYL